MHQVGLEGYGYPGSLDLVGILSWISVNGTKVAAVAWNPGGWEHPCTLVMLFVCSQRVETLQQGCQVACALLQGIIDRMKAMQQPMAPGVSVPLKSSRMFP